MTFSITLVRHARSEANAAGIWQGQGDAALAQEGRDQARALEPRLTDRQFDVVISSDLARTQETAELAGRTPDRIEKSWREMDLGAWEGRTFAEVAERHPDLLEAIRRGEAVSFGETGETIGEFEQRILDAFDRLVDEVGDEGDALVFTHGGVIDAVVGRYFGRIQGRRTFPITTNTAMTVLADTFGADRPVTMMTERVDRSGPLSEKVPIDPVTRSFDSFAEAAEECSMSRVYLGIHFRYDSVEGVHLGRRVGSHVVEVFLRPSREGDPRAESRKPDVKAELER